MKHFNKQWLADQYITQGKTLDQIAQLAECAHTTIANWLERFNIPQRSTAERYRLQGEKTRGKNNHHFKGGSSQGYQKRTCARSGRPCVCAWCGTEGTEEQVINRPQEMRCSLQFHHKDHNKENGELDNLVYLCPKCHRLETALWHIRKSKKANVSVSNKIIIIDFNV